MTLRALPWLLLVVALTSACVPADAGRDVTVQNDCDGPVTFLLGGGTPPESPDKNTPNRLAGSRTETYSVLVEEGDSIFIWLRDPPAEKAVTFPAGRSASDGLVLAGSPCGVLDG